MLVLSDFIRATGRNDPILKPPMPDEENAVRSELYDAFARQSGLASLYYRFEILRERVMRERAYGDYDDQDDLKRLYAYFIAAQVLRARQLRQGLAGYNRKRGHYLAGIASAESFEALTRNIKNQGETLEDVLARSLYVTSDKIDLSPYHVNSEIGKIAQSMPVGRGFLNRTVSFRFSETDFLPFSMRNEAMDKAKVWPASWKGFQKTLSGYAPIQKVEQPYWGDAQP